MLWDHLFDAAWTVVHDAPWFDRRSGCLPWALLLVGIGLMIASWFFAWLMPGLLLLLIGALMTGLGGWMVYRFDGT